LFLNSLATGQKIRVPLGALVSSIITQALSSNLTYEPSFLLTSFLVLTITAFTTFFFFTVPSGAAFLTVQTITSQIEAYLLCEPPSTLIHNTSLAQELSVTASLDSVCIIRYQFLKVKIHYIFSTKSHLFNLEVGLVSFITTWSHSEQVLFSSCA